MDGGDRADGAKISQTPSPFRIYEAGDGFRGTLEDVLTHEAKLAASAEVHGVAASYAIREPKNCLAMRCDGALARSESDSVVNRCDQSSGGGKHAKSGDSKIQLAAHVSHHVVLWVYPPFRELSLLTYDSYPS